MTDKKIPVPEAPESEMIVIGSVFEGGRSAMKKIDHIVTHLDFYQERNRLVFRAMERLYAEGMDIDITTVAEVLKQRGYLDAVDGISGLLVYTEGVFTSNHIVSHAKIVANRSTLRNVIKASKDIIRMTATEEDLEALLIKAESRLKGVIRSSAQAENRLAIVELEEWRDIARTSELPAGTVRGISTGYKGIDDMLEGFEPGELVTLTGHTKHGKSRLAANIALNIADSGHTVMFINTEMTKLQMGRRFNAMIDDKKIKGKILLNDKGNLEAMDVISLMEKAKEMGVEVVVIDHLHFFSRSVDNQTNEISKITKEFKEAAVEFELAVLLLCHVQQADTKKRPTLQMLKNSSSIAQDSDVVITVWMDDRPNGDNSYTEVIRLAHRSAQNNVRKIVLFNQGMRLTEQAPPQPAGGYNANQFTEGGASLESVTIAGW